MPGSVLSTGDPNTVLFLKDQEPLWEMDKEALNGKIGGALGRVVSVPGPGALASPGDLLGEQHLKPHPRHEEAKSTLYQNPQEILFTHSEVCSTLLDITVGSGKATPRKSCDLMDESE